MNRNQWVIVVGLVVLVVLMALSLPIFELVQMHFVRRIETGFRRRGHLSQYNEMGEFDAIIDARMKYSKGR